MTDLPPETAPEAETAADAPTEAAPDAAPDDGEPTALEPAAEPPKDRAWFQLVLLYAVTAGLCPLSPLPFIDDLAIHMLHRRMIRSQFALAGITLSDPQINALVDRKSGFLRGCLTTVFLYPIKKIFRKVFYFFAVKDCVDVTSELLHRGLLLQLVIDERRITADDLTPDHAALLRINDAMTVALREIDPRPINQLLKRTFAGSRALVKEAAGVLARTFRKRGVSRKEQTGAEDAMNDLADAESGPIGSFVNRIDQAIWSKEGYREELSRRFIAALDASTAPPA